MKEQSLFNYHYITLKTIFEQLMQNKTMKSYQSIMLYLQQDIMNNLTWTQKNFFTYANIMPAIHALGSSQFKLNVSSFTEFDPLKLVIVGYIDDTAGTIIDFDHVSVTGTQQVDENEEQLGQKPFPLEYIKTAQKNLNDLVVALQKEGVQVVRVAEMDFRERFIVNGQQTRGFCAFSPRDIPFTYHDSMYEFPVVDISRSTQYKCFEWIQKQLYQNGSKVFAAWQPYSKKPGYRYAGFQGNSQEAHIYYQEDEYFADAANLLKLGLDILFQISASGSKGAFNKFRYFMQKRYKGVVRVHPAIDIYGGYHFDTTISIVGWNKKIQKYIVVCNDHFFGPQKLPAIFRGKNWAVIWFSDFQQQFFDPKFSCSSKAIAINFLTVTPELIVLSPNQTELKRILQFYGIRILVCQNKHSRQLGGGSHCITNDLHRQDVKGFTKVLEKDPSELSLEERAGLFDPQLLRFLQSKGKIEDWMDICNKNHIFGNYLTDHLTQKKKEEFQNKLGEVYNI